MPHHRKDIDETRIIEMYGSGKYNSEQIAETFSISPTTVCDILRENGISRDSRYRRTYDCNHSFFDTIDTEEKAYWLGFHAADGTASIKSNTWRFNLAVKDQDHLEKLKTNISSNHIIRNYWRRSHEICGNIVGDLECAILAITSPQLVRGLDYFGFTGKKFDKITIPKIERDLIRHFIRGYFDGDGWVCTNKGNKKIRWDELNFGFCGNIDFLYQIKLFIEREIGISLGSVYIKKGKFGSIKIGGNKKSSVFGRWLYDGATVWLDRKKKVFDDFTVEYKYRPKYVKPAKVSWETVSDILHDYEVNKMKQIDIAEKYGLTAYNIGDYCMKYRNNIVGYSLPTGVI